jgi:threonine/homoserine/homoserine lactone efflux protein
MQALIPFLKSFLLGLSIAAPLGPIGLLCIRYAITFGFKYGLSVGLGAALADAFYGVLMASGMGFVALFLSKFIIFIKVVGGLLLIYLAVIEWKSRKNKPNESSATKGKDLMQITLSVFLLTLSNPLTLLFFLGVFSSSLGKTYSFVDIVSVVLGIFLGSLSWWIFLSKICSMSKKFLSLNMMIWIKNISIFILLGFGIASLFSAFLNGGW